MNPLLEQTITVHVEWHNELKRKPYFSFQGILSGGENIDPSYLNSLLFGWHEKLFYGTLLELQERDIHLDPLMAMYYFADPQHLQHVQVEFALNISVLQEAAQLFRKALENGWYAPDMEGWYGIVDPAWKLMLPADENRRYSELLQNADQAGISYLPEWFTQIIREVTTSDSAVLTAWEAVVKDHPQLSLSAEVHHTPEQTSASSEDEKDWLIDIGWTKDHTPFTASLQIVEPDDAEYGFWQLRLILRDPKSDDYAVCDMDGRLLDGNLPVNWHEHVQDLVRNTFKRCQFCSPELVTGTEPMNIKSVLTAEEAWHFLTETSLQVAKTGLPVMLPSWWEAVQWVKPKIKARLKSSVGSAQKAMVGLNQIVQFDWSVAIGDTRLNEAEFKQAVQSKRRLIQFNGQWVVLDPAHIQQIHKKMKQLEKQGLTVRDALEHALTHTGDEVLADDSSPDTDVLQAAVELEVELNEHMQELLSQLQQTKNIPLLPVPQAFKGTLRPYQQLGSSWMVFLHQFGLGGCLADDMGLGKTIQWITYLLHLKESGSLQSPALLVCPTSVLGNWQKELERFAPSLQVYLHYGPQRVKGEGFRSSIERANLVITSYTLAHLDAEELSSLEWESLCLDEAQNIKNAYTKQSKAVRGVHARHRLALTGTPVENRLTELWSIFDFINPQYLGDLNTFKRRYIHPIEKRNDHALILQMQRLVQPFLLRRVKKDPSIQLDLPEKNEMKTYVKLTKEQAALYESMLQQLFDTIDRLPPMERRGAVLATLTRLKQICNDPQLLGNTSSLPDIERSHKLSRLFEMVQEIREEGESCLIFTQFVNMGHIIREGLQKTLQEKALFLHGGVSKQARDRMIQQFQQAPGKGGGIFVLSLKAGGIGLNLTAANHVFHFDRWWNPAVENQATDRAYRIGQSRNVQVHKMITLGTLEERIDEMLEQKSSLSEQIIGGGEQWITEMSTQQLHDVFALRKHWIE